MQTNSILPADVSHSRLFEALARLRTARRFPDKRYEVIAEEACSLAAEMRGYLSFSHMRSAFYLSSIFEKNKPSFAFTPTNYEIGLSWYDLVNTTLRFLFGERTGIRGLHLASNYGLNVHFF